METQGLVPDMSSSQLKRHLLRWEEIGPKWAGTKGEATAREYVRTELESYDGVDTRTEWFEFSEWAPIATSVRMTEPVQDTLDCVPISYLADDEVSGEVVYAGSGSRAEFETLVDRGVDFEGKVVLVTNDVPFMITPIAQEHGAAALLTITDARMAGLSDVARRCAGAFYGTTATSEEMIDDPASFPADIPGAMLPMSAGHRLLSLLSTGSVTVTVSNEAHYSVGETANVIGVIEGTTHPEETVVVGSHYDTEFTAPGVWDNGSGTAGTLELARAFAASDVEPERTMVFVVFSCEENGCWGSVNYVDRHREDLEDGCVGMINLDSLGSPLTAHNTLWASDGMDDFMIETAEMVDWDVDALTGVDATFSDYAPFRDIGVPNAWVGDFDHLHPYYHTSGDTIDYMSVGELSRALEYTGTALRRLATMERPP
jgi:Iap family predicted aminopeptidase